MCSSLRRTLRSYWKKMKGKGGIDYKMMDTQPQTQSQVLVQQVDNLAAGSPVVPGEIMSIFRKFEKCYDILRIFMKYL